MNTTVIIPIHNILKRGFYRLDLSLYSLRNQCKVIVVDSSEPGQEVWHICRNYPNVRYVPVRSSIFNKPLLHNTGVVLSDTDWVLMADADFCYQPDFITELEVRSKTPKDFFVKLIYATGNEFPTFTVVDNWAWKNKKPFPFGREANALQYFHKEWFAQCGGYDEQMVGFGGMDNDMVNRATLAGMNVQYIECDSGAEVVHVWHKQEKNWNGSDMRANWKIRDNRKNIKVND